MFEMLDKLEIIIREANFYTRMAILFISIVIGIVLSQLTFALLRKAVSRITDRSYPLARRAFRGIPTVWGILLGGFIAVQILTIPPRALLFLERIFKIIGIISFSIMGARLVSSFLTQKLQKTASTFASTSILVTLIELIVYITGFFLSCAVCNIYEHFFCRCAVSICERSFFFVASVFRLVEFFYGVGGLPRFFGAGVDFNIFCFI